MGDDKKPKLDEKTKKPIRVIDKPSEPKALYGYGGTESGTPPTNQIKENTTKTLQANGSPKDPMTLSEVVVTASRKKKKDENPILLTHKIEIPLPPVTLPNIPDRNTYITPNE